MAQVKLTGLRCLTLMPGMSLMLDLLLHKAHQAVKFQGASIPQSSACVTLADVSLTKVRHMASPKSMRTDYTYTQVLGSMIHWGPLL